MAAHVHKSYGRVGRGSAASPQILRFQIIFCISLRYIITRLTVKKEIFTNLQNYVTCFNLREVQPYRGQGEPETGATGTLHEGSRGNLEKKVRVREGCPRTSLLRP